MVLWAYRTNPHSTTGESPFRLMYETKAVIPIELAELTWRTSADSDFLANAANLREKLEFKDEVRSEAALRETTLKQKIAARHSKKVIKREFKVGDLVLRRNQNDFKDNSKRLLCSITQERDFYAQGQLQETSMLKDNSKRLLNNYKELNTV